jgi:hypothetical protein
VSEKATIGDDLHAVIARLAARSHGIYKGAMQRWLAAAQDQSRRTAATTLRNVLVNF